MYKLIAMFLPKDTECHEWLCTCVKMLEVIKQHLRLSVGAECATPTAMHAKTSPAAASFNNRIISRSL
jgi:hypothetical protein